MVAPAIAAQPDANLPLQQIGPHDLIAISVYDAPEFTRTVRVGADGRIRLPMLKQRIKVDGLMPGDLETAIAAALQAEQLMVEPFVTVTIAEYGSRAISVAGAVRQPLTFQAAIPVTLLEALTRAGGLSPEAGADIFVSLAHAAPTGDPSAQVRRIPVRGLMDAAAPAMNILLTGGEEIRVPEAGKVYVIGDVKRPGAYAATDGAGPTVLKMLALSEGLVPFAAKEAYIYRRETSGGKNEIPIPLNRIIERKAPDVALLANDILYVPDNKRRRLSLGAIEKIVMFGTGAGTAAIYAAAVH